MQPRRNPPRRAKRKRDDVIDAVPLSNLYLDALSDDSLQLVVQNLSCYPHAPDWQRFFEPEDVLCLLRMGGRYAVAVRSNFRGLELCRRWRSNFRPLGVCGGAAGDTSLPVVVDCISSLNLARNLLAGLDAALFILRIDLGAIPSLLSSSFVKYCKGLRHLAVYMGRDGFPLPALLKRCGRQLVTLQLEGSILQKDVTAIGKNCRKLQNLTLHGDVRARLDGMFSNPGESLRTLRLESPSVSLGLPAMRFFLNVTELKARSVDFDAALGNLTGSGGDRLVDLCSKFGSSLSYLNLLQAPGLKADHFHRLREMCPNAQIDLRYFEGHARDIVNNLVAIGEAAIGLRIYEPYIVENLDLIGNACPNLQDIALCTDDMPVSGLRALFQTPKPKLVKLNIFPSEHVQQTQVVDSIFEVLAEKVSTLKEFFYEGPVPTLRVLAPFAAANSNMKTVSIAFDFPDGSVCPCRSIEILDVSGTSSIQSGTRIWKAVTAAFLQIKGLEFLTSRCVGDNYQHEKVPCFANMCTPARLGSTSVRMCYYQFF